MPSPSTSLQRTRQGRLMNGVVVVGHARQQQADDPGHQRMPSRPERASSEEYAQRQQRRPGGGRWKRGRSPPGTSDLLPLPSGQTAQQRAEIFGDIPGNSSCPVSSSRSRSTTISFRWSVVSSRQSPPDPDRPDADGQMLADRQQIGQVGGRVEGPDGVHIVAQQSMWVILTLQWTAFFRLARYSWDQDRQTGPGMAHGRTDGQR